MFFFLFKQNNIVKLAIYLLLVIKLSTSARILILYFYYIISNEHKNQSTFFILRYLRFYLFCEHIFVQVYFSVYYCLLISANSICQKCASLKIKRNLSQIYCWGLPSTLYCVPNHFSFSGQRPSCLGDISNMLAVIGVKSVKGAAMTFKDRYIRLNIRTAVIKS